MKLAKTKMELAAVEMEAMPVAAVDSAVRRCFFRVRLFTNWFKRKKRRGSLRTRTAGHD